MTRDEAAQARAACAAVLLGLTLTILGATGYGDPETASALIAATALTAKLHRGNTR